MLYRVRLAMNGVQTHNSPLLSYFSIQFIFFAAGSSPASRLKNIILDFFFNSRITSNIKRNDDNFPITMHRSFFLDKELAMHIYRFPYNGIY
jgi:hypothetical protein